MFSSFLQKPEGEEPPNESATAPSPPPLTKEEIRLKRLQKVEETVLSEKTSGNALEIDATQPSPADTKRNKDGDETSSPLKKSLKTSGPQSPIASSTTDAQKSTPKKDPAALEALKIDRDNRALNMNLEFALQLTLRREAAVDSIQYCGHDGITMSNSFLNASNISELMCGRLNEQTENAVMYLSGCYKRIVAKESSASPAVQAELAKCRKQIISLLGSCLGVPELFDANSANSVRDLAASLQEDASPVMVTMLKDLIEELNEQGYLPMVMEELAASVYSKLDNNPVAVQPGNPFSIFQGPGANSMRSVLDDFSAALSAVGALVRTDKRVCKELVAQKCFLNSELVAVSRFPNLQHVPPQMRHHPRFIEAAGTRGAAMEHQTLLGRVLRISPEPRDPKLAELFKDTQRTPRNIVEGKIQDLRKRCAQAQTVGVEILMSCLRAGGPAKAGAMQWLVQSLVQNIEVEKDQPSPLLGASSGFMLNLGAVMLQLAHPVIADAEKLKKVDLFYLFANEGKVVFPDDLTKLMPLAYFSSLANAAGSLPPPAPPAAAASTAEFNFITQSFFLCWRALHLGIVPQCNRYENILRGLNHHHAGLETNDPHAMHYLVLKFGTDAQLLSPDLLQEIVLFCSAASTKLIDTLEPPQHAKHAMDVSSGDVEVNYQDWLCTPEQLTSDQKHVLLNLPEHLVDDIMTMLIFVARTDPAILKTASMDSTLSLIVFFLRRPWAIQKPHLRAKFGLTLFHVFLPASARSRGDMWSQNAPVDGPHTNLLSTHIMAQRYMSPGLLLLYGDVERTGFYEKLTNRRCIMVVLKHLWTLPTHRSAFRGIATLQDTFGSSTVPASSSSSGATAEGSGQDYFVRFANGLMNETNALVAATMDKLVEIRKTQLQMQNLPEWG
eukprot:gene17808-20285_t